MLILLPPLEWPWRLHLSGSSTIFRSLLYLLHSTTYAAGSIAEDSTCPQNETRIKTFRCEEDCYHVGAYPELTLSQIEGTRLFSTFQSLQCDSPPPSCHSHRAFPRFESRDSYLIYNITEWEAEIKGRACLLVQAPILNLSICAALNPANPASLPMSEALLLSLCFDSRESAVLNAIRPVKAPFEKFKSFTFFSHLPLSFPSSVKPSNKKAEKNKKGTLKTPNSISEGEGQYAPVKEGELTPDATRLATGENSQSHKTSVLCCSVQGSFLCLLGSH